MRTGWRGISFGFSRGIEAVVFVAVVAAPVSSFAQTLSDPRQCIKAPGAPQCEEITLRRALAVLNADDSRDDSTSARSFSAVERAHRLFRAACDGGFGDACYFAAEFTHVDSLAADLHERGCYTQRPSGAACAGAGDVVHGLGMGRPRNADSAFVLYRRGCAMDRAGGRVDRTACYLAGWGANTMTSLPSVVRESLADSLLFIACREGRGSPRGCIELASSIQRYWERNQDGRFHSTRYQRDAKRIWAILQGGCSRAFMESCAHVGRFFETGSFTRGSNADSARHYYEHACYAGGDRPAPGEAPAGSSAVGCQMLGDLLLARGTATDSSAALEHYRQGCDQLSAASCVLHAVHTYGERPVFSIFRVATECESGSADACFEAARLADRSASTDVARASEYRGLAQSYFERGCELDHGGACNGLGDLYWPPLGWLGRGGASTPSVAWSDSTTLLRVKYYRRACGLKNPDGCRNLANVLRTSFTGRGEPLEYQQLACTHGHSEACWDAMLEYRKLGDVASEGRMRGLACRRSSMYCKKKAER